MRDVISVGPCLGRPRFLRWRSSLSSSLERSLTARGRQIRWSEDSREPTHYLPYLAFCCRDKRELVETSISRRCHRKTGVGFQLRNHNSTGKVGRAYWEVFRAVVAVWGPALHGWGDGGRPRGVLCGLHRHRHIFNRVCEALIMAQ